MGNTTIIVVGVTETDEWGNLWVTPKGGGDKVKVAKKREHLHELFQQGRAVMLIWQTYQNIPYVADAKLVEGELPPPTNSEDTSQPAPKPVKSAPVPQEIGMFWKEMGEMLRAGPPAGIDLETAHGKLLRQAYYAQMLAVLDIKLGKKEGV